MKKLTIEEKKIIAEKVHGWKTYSKGFPGEVPIRFYIKPDELLGNWLSDYNPDQDTPEGLTQFVEMLEALDENTCDALESYLENELLVFEDVFFHDFKWLCKHKYEVCMAVKEVIK